MNVRDFLLWIVPPSALVVVAVVASTRTPPDGVGADESMLMDSDGKLDRTLDAFYAANAGLSMDRPGLRVDLTVSEEDRLAFREDWNHSAEAAFAFDGKPSGRGQLRVRGKSSRRSERKSFSAELVRAQSFGDFALERFLLLNLLFDPGGFEMYTSFALLEELGLFVSHRQYVALYVNGNPDGLYLLVEPPEDALRRSVPGLLGVFRPGRFAIDVEYTVPRPDPMELVNRFVALPERNLSAEAESEEAERLFDLELYFRWLAFNALFENGDSRNELYYYERELEQGSVLSLVAWDYDDVQEPPIRPLEAVRDPLFYAAEMPFDLLVRDNPVLYRRYRATLGRVLDEITESELARRLQEARDLLDSIDTGLDEPRRLEAAAARARDIERFEARLIARHRELRALLDDG